MFWAAGENHIRISYAASRENLTEAMKRMAHFVTKYKNKVLVKEGGRDCASLFILFLDRIVMRTS